MIDFSQIIDRRNTNCAKWDEMDEKYKRSDLIHLGVADMDFKAPAAIREKFSEVIEHGIFGYTNPGPEFYSSIQRWMKKQIQEDIPEEWIVFCPRINVSAGLVVGALTGKGEGVMLHTPCYMPLYHGVKKNERQVIESPLKQNGTRYEMDFEQMEASVTENTRILMLCSPHNPCGRVWEKTEMEMLAEFCIRHNLIMISDEIHADIKKEEIQFTSALNLKDALKEQLVYVNSPTKTFNIPGIILSYLIIPNQELRKQVMEEIDRVGMHNPTVFANAAIQAGYTLCDEWLLELNRYINSNEDYVRNYVKEHMPAFKIMEREGTYLLWIDCRALMVTMDQLEYWFIHEARVGVYMGTAFGTEGMGFIRWNLGTPLKVLEEALYRMKEAYPILETMKKEKK